MKMLLFLLFTLPVLNLSAQKNYHPFTKQQENWLKEATAAAENGNTDSMVSVGVFLLNVDGAGPKIDKKYPWWEDNVNGKAWLKKSAMAGNPAAGYRLSLYYLSKTASGSDSWRDSVAYYNDLAVKSGKDPDVRTMYFLGERSLSFDRSAIYSPAKAKEWFSKAAALHYAPSEKQMLMFATAENDPYYNGIKAYLAGNYSEAYKYWKADALVNKNCEAMFQIGSLFYTGIDIKNKAVNEMYAADEMIQQGFDFETTVGLNGLQWFTRSSNCGYPGASMMLGEIMAKDNLMDYAMQYWKLAGDQGYYQGTVKYERALKIKNDIALARQAAAEQREKDEILQKNMPKGKNWKVCKTCSGSGTIKNPIQSSLEQDKNGRWHSMGTQMMSCWTCNGKGYIDF